MKKRPLLLLAVVPALLYLLVSSLFPKDGEPFPEEGKETAYYGKITEVSLKPGKQVFILKTRIGKKTVRILCTKEDTSAYGMPFPGEQVSVLGRVYYFPEANNPGAFDSRAYYEALGVSFGFSVRSMYCVRETRNLPAKLLLKLKARLMAVVRLCAPETDRETALSVISGESAYLPEQEKTIFSVSGFYRLLHVSGLQIGLFLRLIYRILKRRMKSPQKAAVLSAVLVPVPLLFTGFSFSACRAAFFFLYLLLSKTVKRRADPAISAALFLFFVLAFFPGVMRLYSFKCFGTVLFSTGILGTEIRRFSVRVKKRQAALTGMLLLLAGLLPLSLWEQFTVSPFSILTGSLFSPLAFLTLGTIFAGAFSGIISETAGCFFFGVAELLLKAVRFLSGWITSLPGAFLINGKPPLAGMGIYLLLFVGLYLFIRIQNDRTKQLSETGFKALRQRIIPVICPFLLLLYLFGILFLRTPDLKDGESEIIFLDVGQGDGALIRLPGRKAILVDCGSSSDDSCGSRVLRPALYYYGIRQLDAVFLSHGDEDHTSGVLELLRVGYPVKLLYLSETRDIEKEFDEILQEAAIRNLPVRTLCRGDELSSDSFQIRCLWPESGYTFSGNRGSSVLLFRFSGIRVLFTGDISSEEENMILTGGTVDILKTAHHGSRFSSDSLFLQKIRPGIAVISSGRNNLYGHPHPDTLMRLRESGAEVFRTDETGAVHVKCTKGKLISVYGARDGDRHFVRKKSDEETEFGHQAPDF